jgi:uncharacterized protein YdeI (YjbR/CyaY-like superfamily)
MKKDGVKIFYAKDRASWRKWLKKNHSREEKIWLTVYHKKSDTPSVYYADAVEEALCFGWIDSKSVKRDGESAYLTFTKGNPKSRWSKINKQRVKKLIRAGLMTKAGLEMIRIAKESKTWTALDKLDKAVMPADLKKRLATNVRARKNFEKFPPSTKKHIFGWISEAKRPETRTRRIRETVSQAAKNIRANQ